MSSKLGVLLVACVGLLVTSLHAFAMQNSDEFVRSIVNSPDIDFAQAKLALDAFVDPASSGETPATELDSMASTVTAMIAASPGGSRSSSLERMKVLRTFLYSPGAWNDDRPFVYDHADPYGQNVTSQLLSTYIQTRKGNCISMPILFLILGERLGLQVTLSTAPLHVFVKYTDDETGATWNLEATSGAGFTRDAWYHAKLPMTETAIANGVYLKTLSRKEALVVISTLVLDHLMKFGRYDEAIAVADVLLEAWPEYEYALVKKGTAYYRLLNDNIIKRYPRQSDIPADRVAYADELYRANQETFARAEELGWRMPKLD